MSVKAMSAVFEHSLVKGNDRLTLLTIADNANDVGFAWPGIEEIHRKGRIEPRTIMRCVDRCESAGELVVLRRPGTHNIYLLRLEGLDDVDERALEAIRKRFGDDVAAWVERMSASDTLSLVTDDTLSGVDPTVTGDNHDTGPVTRVSPEPPRTTRPTSSLRSDASSSRSRALSISEQIANRHLAPIVEKLASGYAFDLRAEIIAVWARAWNEAVDTDGANPKATGQALAAAYFFALLDDDLAARLTQQETSRVYAMLARLVGQFGTAAMIGLGEALGRDLQGRSTDLSGIQSSDPSVWYPYAVTVARSYLQQHSDPGEGKSA